MSKSGSVVKFLGKVLFPKYWGFAMITIISLLARYWTDGSAHFRDVLLAVLSGQTALQLFLKMLQTISILF